MRRVLTGLFLGALSSTLLADVEELDADALQEAVVTAPAAPGGKTDAEDLQDLETQQRHLPGANVETRPLLLIPMEEIPGPSDLQQLYLDAILNAADQNLPPPPPPTP